MIQSIISSAGLIRVSPGSNGSLENSIAGGAMVGMGVAVGRSVAVAVAGKFVGVGGGRGSVGVDVINCSEDISTIGPISLHPATIIVRIKRIRHNFLIIGFTPQEEDQLENPAI